MSFGEADRNKSISDIESASEGTGLKKSKGMFGALQLYIYKSAHVQRRKYIVRDMITVLNRINQDAISKTPKVFH